MKCQRSAFTRIKLQIIPIILTATFLLLNSTPGQALWGEKIKKITDDELTEIKTELNLSQDSRFYPYSDPDLKEVLNKEIDPQKTPGLTSGVFILNAIYEEKLVEMCYPDFYDEESSHFFSLLADNLTSWQKNFAEKTTKIAIEAIIEAYKMHGLSIGTSSLFLAVDLAQIGVGIIKLAEVVRNRALSFYLGARSRGDSHEVAWSVAGIPPLYDNWQTQEFFKSLWNKYEKYMSEDRLYESFKQQQRESLRVSLLYALGAQAHPILTSPLEIASYAPYYIGDKINAEFTITNEGVVPISFDVLTVGGRNPDDQVADFTFRYDIMLNPNQSYNYKGTLALTKAGKYHFFCTYQTQDGEWNTSVDLASGLTDEDRTEDIAVKTEAASAVEQDQEANKLYVEAYQLSELAWQVVSYSEALALHKKALTNLETIISRYPSSNVAVELIRKNELEEVREDIRWTIPLADAEKSLFACAVYLIKNWYTGGGDPVDEFVEFSTIATKYANIGQKDKTLKILNELLSKAKKLRFFEYRTEGVGVMAFKYAEIGQFEQAFRILEEEKGIPQESVILLPIEHADLDQLDKVLDAVRATNWAYSQDWALPALQKLIKIAGRYAELGQEDQAEQTLAEALVGARGSSKLLTEIAANYAELDQKNRALEVLEEAFEALRVTETSTYRDRLSDNIATIYADLGEKGKAAEVLTEAAGSVESPKLYPLTEIASKCIDLGLNEEALKVPQAASGSTKIVVLINIASKFIKLGQKEKAEEALNEAVSVSLDDDDDDYVYDGDIKLHSNIIAKLIELGEEKKARELLSIALKRGEKRTGVTKDWAFVDLALQFVSLGQPERAFEIIDKVEGWWGVEIANKYIELGQLEKAFEIAKGWRDYEILAEIANKYIELGQLEKALEIIKGWGSTLKAEILAKIANKYIELGQLEKALEIGRGLGNTSIFAKIANKYIELGQLEKALEIGRNYSEKLAKIANKYIELGQLEKALEIIESTDHDFFSRNQVLIEIATKYANIDQKDKTQEILNKVLKDIPIEPGEIEPEEIGTLIEIDIKYIELGLTVEEKEKKIIREIIRNS